MEDFQQRIQSLKEASILDIPSKLMEFELHDEKAAYEVFDELSATFQKEDLVDNVVTPSICTVVDSVLALPCFKGATRKMGLSAQRVMRECQSFNYDASLSFLMPESQTETRNFSDYASSWSEEHRPMDSYDRNKYQNTSEMGRYKRQKIEENGGRVNFEDEYRLTYDISGSRAGSDKRRNDPKFQYVAETDHIIPLKTIFAEVHSNAGLSDDDIRRIANQPANFAVTARMVNNPKRDMSNSEFIAKQDELKAAGKPYVELNEEQRANMIRMEREAQEAIDDSINDTILKNLSGRGHTDRAIFKEKLSAKEKELGRKLKPSDKEYQKIEAQCIKEKTTAIYAEASGHAANQGLLYTMGNAILLIIKPLYFELKDSFMNGFQAGVGASSMKDAFSLRFGRIRDYVWKQLTSIKTYIGGFLDFIKNFISSLIESLLNMFVGLFKQVFRLVKEGIKLVMQSSRILFGESSKNLSASEKGDAIVHLIGGSIAAFCGIAIDSLLQSINMPGAIRGVVSTLVSGIAGIIVFYAMDKADFFNVKEERRHQRIKEVFDMRISDIQEKTCEMSQSALEALRESTIKFNSIISKITNASSKSDYEEITYQTGLLYTHLFGKNIQVLEPGFKWDC